ncbi:hypothetical protein TrLO_g1888 [Triparma laevis f. longispina]|uniref:N-acetyltransferase domain-containing protein n=1 Tax=Triparma laevis f. longispina TaxID=1714387 RepID=A0A9W7FJB8_9STRA|nr:hypothetical protein TrLO_g1888 [Triparma laevis f. longispina]
MSASLTFRPVAFDEIDAAFAIESASYPSDEAATLSGLTYRQSEAGEYFIGCYYKSSQLIGFICATRCSEFEEDSMSTHSPSGEILAIHSVVIKEDERRKGYATKMLKNYLDILSPSPPIKKIALIAKQNLLEFYINSGFTVTRLSPIIHGSDRWFELTLDFIEFKRPKYKVIDAFTSKAGSGNPAAVVWDFGEKDDEWLLGVAKEFNLSETVFVYPLIDGARKLRFFTPMQEISLCGHATLSSGFVFCGEEEVRFLTREDVELIVSKTGGNVKMTFPLKSSKPITENVSSFQKLINEGFKIENEHIGNISGTRDDDGNIFNVLVEVTESGFNSIKPDFNVIKTSPLYTHGIIITKSGGRDDADFSSRYFAPKIGIEEDPVTGSAHCTSGPYWAEKGGKGRVVGFQESERGGRVVCGVDWEGGRVELEGGAVCVCEGKIQF